MGNGEILYPVLFTAGSILLLHIWRRSSGGVLARPPSPARLPFIGHLLSVPPGSEHVAYMKLGHQLKSDIVFLNILGLNIVVLNSVRAATDLLEKRSAKFSDRTVPRALAHPDLFDWPNAVSMLPYNDIWRFHRRVLNGVLNVKAVTRFHGQQELQARLLLQRLLDLTGHPRPFEGVKKEFFYTMAVSMFEMAYGYRLQGKDDPILVESEKAFHNGFCAVMFANFYVNIIPALMYVPEWFPGAGWKRKIRSWKAQKVQAMSAPYEWVKAKVADGTAQPSVLSAILQDDSLCSTLSPDIRDTTLEQLGIIFYAGNQIGGTDTSATALLNFIAAMTLYPDVQEKAQLELDTVLGSGVLPTVSDRDRLPYINNLVLELLRWRPVLPIAIPHVCYEDDVYRGYDFVKGDIIIGNVWAMSRDENIYSNPDEFNPDRFLDPSVPLAPGFGWGRRKCPGLHYGESSVFIVLSSILTMYTISKRKDSNGVVIQPEIKDAPNSLTLELEHFDFELQPRSDKHLRLVLEAVV
ncbi:Cytochrome P450 1A1 [Rhizoctonia solani]|uniref:Cytochrome P450 1A1 n=1 Tax=Rhizoctonia solani TaxID=456999 RepID=A0A0K6GH75_9AGAM|nr:Cytochrome P450 1A1 [Rhizoctonia solani]